MNVKQETILIIDDEITNLKLLTQLLSRKGYKVRAAERPQMAIDSALAHPPDLILLDVCMPKMDGFEVCRRFKENKTTREIPIIFVSGLNDISEKLKGFKAGGVDFISKPFQEPEVLARVKTHLQLYGMQVRLEEMVAQRTRVLSQVNQALTSEIAERKLAEDKVLKYQGRLKALASQLTLAEEKERRRIAADLHDHIGQTLAFSRIQVAKAKKLTQDGPVSNILEELSQSLLSTIRDTKDLVFDLSSPLLNEIGLGAAISSWLNDQVSIKNGIQTRFSGLDEKIDLGPDVNAILFRNVRELLANAVRHARPKSITVKMEQVADQLQIMVADDGIGFDPKKNNDTDGLGFGLFSIRERMGDLGGTMAIQSSVNCGCRVILSFPLDLETQLR